MVSEGPPLQMKKKVLRRGAVGWLGTLPGVYKRWEMCPPFPPPRVGRRWKEGGKEQLGKEESVIGPCVVIEAENPKLNFHR